MQNVYSSTALRNDKRHGWQEYVSEIFVPLELNIDQNGGREFIGEIHRASLASLDITRMVTDREYACHGMRHIARYMNSYFLFITLKSGKFNLSQYDRDCRVAADHYTMIDLSAPFDFSHDDRIHGLGLKIPSEFLLARLPDPRDFCAVPRPIRPGFGRMVVGLLNSLLGDAAHMGATAAAVAENSLLDLITFLFESEASVSPRSSSVRWATHRRCISFLKSHYADPHISPTTLATAMGISVRYLHKIFEETGQTIGEYLLDLRLDRSYEALAQPGMAQFSIKQLALRNGFQNQSHFSTAFKAKYGVSPSEKRRSLMTKIPLGGHS